jgi:putative ABC transport system permease protein
MDHLLQDLRYGARTLMRAPLFTGASLLCLALGIGANTAIFSMIDGVLLRPLPYAQPERLVVVWENFPARGRDRNVVAPANYLDWRAQNHVFADMATFVSASGSLTGQGEPIEVPTAFATATLFPLLGVTPLLGRTFSAAEDAPNGPTVVVLGYGIWQRVFGGRTDIINQQIMLRGVSRTVIGVLPSGFRIEGTDAEIWTPLGLDPSVDYRKRSGRFLTSFARLKPGVTLQQAQSEMNTIGRRLAEANPDFNTGWGVTLVPMAEQVVGSVRRALLVLAGVVGFVLLIAAANVANLQLARATTRSREIAVRAALGAARGRMIRQLLTENVLLATIGGLLGLVLAYWGLEAMTALAPKGFPRTAEITIDGWTLAFTLGVSLATGLLFGVLPAIQASKQDLQHVLKEGMRGTTLGVGARGALVVAQVALSLILLVGAGLMIRSFARLTAVDPGFDPEHVLTARISLPVSKYRTGAQQTAFFAALVDRVRALPSVRAAGTINWLPFGGGGSATDFWIEGRPQPPAGQGWTIDVRGADSTYFRTMGIRMLRGRTFDAAATADAPKQVVVNEAFVRTHFPSEDPLGRHILMPWGDTLRGEIVGVVNDTKHSGLDSLARPMVFWAAVQFPSNFMTLVARTSGDPMAVAPLVAREVHALDADQPVADVKPLEAYLGASVAQRRFSMALLGIFAGVALVLAAIGIYGVLAYSVAQRTREIGVRMALGAREAAVAGMVVRQGMRVVAVGIGIGVVGALALTRVLTSLLYGVSATDPVTFIGVAGALGAVALLASYLPARRAARVDPLVALRAD